MRRLALALLAVAALPAGGCLGSLHRDPAAEAIALAVRAPLRLPVRESRTYWLLRAQDGWEGAHEVRYGGNPGDTAMAVVRAVRFRTDAAAARGFARLTPAYLRLAFRDRLTWGPRPVPYPPPLPGDRTAVTEYGVRLPPEDHRRLTGQMITVLAGTVVLLIDSIDLPPAQLLLAITQLTRAAYQD